MTLAAGVQRGATKAVAARYPFGVLRSPMEGYGDRLRRLRRFWRHPNRRPLTQEELAEMAGVDRRYLGRIETGDVEQPGVETIQKLARALKQPIRALADPRWYEDETPADALDAAERAILSSELSDERKEAALVVIRDLFASSRERTA